MICLVVIKQCSALIVVRKDSAKHSNSCPTYLALYNIFAFTLSLLLVYLNLESPEVRLENELLFYYSITGYCPSYRISPYDFLCLEID